MDTQSECGSASSTDKGLIQILNLISMSVNVFLTSRIFPLGRSPSLF